MPSPTLTLTTLRSQARFFALGDSSSESFTDADTLIAANDAYQKLIIIAIEEAGDWQVRGDNIGTANITAGTRAYDIPTIATDYLRITRVDIKYPGSSDYRRAVPIDQKHIDPDGKDEFTTERPMFDINEDQIEIFVSDKTANISAVSDGIKIYFEDDITALASGSDAPNIPQPFARYMALLMAFDYCLANQMNEKKTDLEREIDKQDVLFRKFIANRNEAKRLSLRPRREDFGQLDMMTEGTDKRSINPSK